VPASHAAPPQSFGLAGKRALVTGASRGIGRACALGLARAGADVALVARGGDALAGVAADIEALGHKALARPADLSHPNQAEAIVADAEAALGTIDILLYAAGVNLRAPAEDVALDQIQGCFDVNTRSAFAISQAIGRRLIAADQPGSLIYIASLMSRGARPTTIPYGISKMALAGIIRGLATEWAPKGIRANAIAPGYVRTEMTEPLYTNPEFHDWVVSRTPQGHWQQPDDYAPIAVFLASDASAIITGQTIYADGGWTAAL